MNRRRGIVRESCRMPSLSINPGFPRARLWLPPFSRPSYFLRPYLRDLPPVPEQGTGAGRGDRHGGGGGMVRRNLSNMRRTGSPPRPGLRAFRLPLVGAVGGFGLLLAVSVGMLAGVGTFTFQYA